MKFVTKKINFFAVRPAWSCKKEILVSFFMLFVLNSCAQKNSSRSPVSLDEKIGQMLMVGFRGLDANDNITVNIAKNKIGGIVLFDYDVPADSAQRNIKSPQQVQDLNAQLQRQAKIPLLIAIDQEGGEVSRLKEKFGFPASVSAQYLGDLNNIDSTRYYAQQTAAMLSKAGINVNLAPVLDLNTNPANPVIGGLNRSFSADPQIVTRHARAYINELHKKNIITALKHFPGHGSSIGDSHKGVVDVTDTWQKIELTPYEKLIDSSYDGIIMTAHIFNARLDSTHPATLSKKTITGILRDSLDFNGVIISDDLQMGAIRKEYGLKETIKRTIQAGVDILCFANNSIYDPKIAPKAITIINELIDEEEISEQRITESYQRIMHLKKRLK